MVLVGVLEQFPVFAGLNQSMLQDVAGIASMRTYEPMERCFGEGEKGRKLYLLVRGRVSIERRLPQSWLHAEGVEHAVIHVVREQELFGWSAVVEPGILTASAHCAERSEVIEVEGKQLLAILDQHSPEGYKFMKRLAAVIASRLSETSERLLSEVAELETYKAM